MPRELAPPPPRARGEVVGELSVLTNAATYDSDAVCVRDCEMVMVSVEAFQRIITLFPKVLKRLSDMVAKRHQEVCVCTHTRVRLLSAVAMQRVHGR